MKNLKAALVNCGYLCDDRTMLFRITKNPDNQKTYQRNKEDRENARTGRWSVSEAKLHPGKQQTVVLLIDHAENPALVQVYAGIYKSALEDEDRKKTLLTQKKFEFIEEVNVAGIAAYVGKSPNSGVIYPFGRSSKVKSENAKKKATMSAKPARDLTEKDASDIQFLQKAQTLTMRRRHNDMTNRLIALWPRIEFGVNKSAMYDALLKDFNGKGDDLMIEVKSNTEIAHIRMAIGQLYSYWHAEFSELTQNLAILLPSRPDAGALRLLKWLKIGVLWFADDQLHTVNPRFKQVATVVR